MFLNSINSLASIKKKPKKLFHPNSITGLVWYFPFTNDLNNYASGTAVNVGCVNNGVNITTADGKNCLDFYDATDYIRLPSMPTNNNGYSIAYSIYLTQDPTDGYCFLNFVNSTTSYYDIITLEINYGSQMTPYSSNSTKIGWFYPFTYSSSLFKDKWNHFVFTINKSDKGAFYLNGTLLNVTQGGQPTYAPNCKYPQKQLIYCSIGNDREYYNNYYSIVGKFNNFLYYDNVLTAEDVSALYNFVK